MFSRRRPDPRPIITSDPMAVLADALRRIAADLVQDAADRLGRSIVTGLAVAAVIVGAFLAVSRIVVAAVN